MSSLRGRLENHALVGFQRLVGHAWLGELGKLSDRVSGAL